MATGFDQYFAELGITQAQFRVLLAVWTKGGRVGVAPSELAELLLIERATVSVLSTRLVNAAWLERRPGENRRSHRLHLTSNGRKLLNKVVPRALQLADATLAGFSRNQLNTIQSGLELIEARLRTLETNSPKEGKS